MLRRFDVELDPETQAGELGIAQQQLVEIARALSRRPRLLILDEPTAALSQAEAEHLFVALRRLRAEGVSCIYISHKLEEVKSLADRITVLRDGETIIRSAADELSTSDLIRHMVGRELTAVYPLRAATARSERALRIEDLAATSNATHSVDLFHVNLSVHAGEILGVGGLMGAGRSELLMHLYGLWGKRIRGHVWLNEKKYSDPSPPESLKRGLMLVTEDRKRFGLIPAVTTNENVSLSSLPAVSRRGWIQQAREHQRNAAALRRTQFRALSDQTPAGRLSGGNQQKVVLARGLLCEPDVVLLDEPTRGVDVAARREIYREVQTLAEQGKAVVWVTSELPELIGICDRIVMMHNGTTAGEFQRQDGFDAARLMASATGQHLCKA